MKCVCVFGRVRVIELVAHDRGRRASSILDAVNQCDWREHGPVGQRHVRKPAGGGEARAAAGVKHNLNPPRTPVPVARACGAGRGPVPGRPAEA